MSGALRAAARHDIMKLIEQGFLPQRIKLILLLSIHLQSAAGKSKTVFR